MNYIARKLPKTTNYKITKDYFRVNGLLYYYQNNNFNRLPNNFEVDPNVQRLSKHPSGAYISFITNSSSIGVKVKLAGKSYMPHFTATGTIGLDLYVLNDDKYTFIGTTKVDEAEFTYTYIRGMNRVNKEFRLYLPLYIELLELELIVDANARLRQDPAEDKQKIICYGTSITQGGCATRSGMSYTSILGRSLKNYDIYNLGFSGNAHLHPEIANLISEVDNLKHLIIEVEANAGDESGVLEDRLEDFIKIILEKQPNLKIYLISHYPHSHTLFNPALKAIILRHKVFQEEICNKYKNSMTFINGQEIFKDLNFEETVDLIHLTDLGFYNLAKYLENIISKN